MIQFRYEHNILLIWAKFFSIGAFFIVPLLLNLMFSVSGRNKSLVKTVIVFSFMLGCAGLLYAFNINYSAMRFKFSPWGNVISLHSVPYVIYFVNALLFLPVGLSLAQIYKKEGSLPAIAKKQANFIMAGVYICSIGLFLDFLHVFDIDVFHIGLLFLGAGIMLMAYAINNYRSLELDLILSKVISAILFIFPVIVLHSLLTGFLLQPLGFLFANSFSLIVVIFLFFFTPYSRFIKDITEKIVCRGRYDYQNVLREFTKNLMGILDLEQLLDYAIHLLVQTLEINKIAVFLQNGTKDMFFIKACYGIDAKTQQDLKFSVQDEFIKQIQKSNKVIILEERKLYFDSIGTMANFFQLGKINAEVVLPLFFKEMFIGFIVLSQKSSGGIYNRGDIRELKAFAAEAAIAIENANVYHDAIIDKMTRVFNQNYFMIRLREEVSRAKRYGQPLALLMLDIDSFKKFNNTFGYDAGDFFLENLGVLLKVKLRTVDIPARYGSEKFAVIVCPNLVNDKQISSPAEIIRKHISGAMTAAERLSNSIRDLKVEFHGKILGATVSIGVVYYDGVDEHFNAEQFIKQAEVALSMAKNAGRDKIIFFNEQN